MLDFTKQYRTPTGILVELFAYRDGTYYGRYQVFDKTWFPLKYHDSLVHDLTEVKPKHTKTYWLVHYKHGSSYCWGENPWFTANQLASQGVIAITGPHTITFEEGQDDRR